MHPHARGSRHAAGQDQADVMTSASSELPMEHRDFFYPGVLSSQEFWVRHVDSPPKVQRFTVNPAARDTFDAMVRSSPLRMTANATPGALPERVLAITPMIAWQPFAGLAIVDYGTRCPPDEVAVDVETVILMAKGEDMRKLLTHWHVEDNWLEKGPARTPVRRFKLEMQGPMDLDLEEWPPRPAGEKEQGTQTLAMFALKYVQATQLAKVSKRARLALYYRRNMDNFDEELDKAYLRDVFIAVRNLGHFWVSVFSS